MQTVIETRAYLAAADDAGMSDEEMESAKDIIARDPTAGDLIVGSGGVRKLRVAGKGKGKSGSYRVITYFGGEDIPVFLLTVFGKGERTNLTRAEVNGLAKLTKTLRDTLGPRRVQ